MATAAFDETLHPRDESGRFAESGGGGGAQVYSPNVAEHTQLDDALTAVRSETQARARTTAAAIDAGAGLAMRQSDAIGDWADGAEASIVAHSNGPVDRDTLRYSAALKGLALNQKAVGIFHAAVDGPDRWYELEVKETDVRAIRAVLAEHGVDFRTLVPTQSGHTIVVIDQGNTLRSAIKGVAHVYGVRPTVTDGHAEFIGADTRDDARAVYTAIVDDYRRRRGLGDERDSGARRSGDADHRRYAEALSAATFDEAEHPRDDAGKFTEGGGDGDGDASDPPAPLDAETLTAAVHAYGLPERALRPALDDFTRALHRATGAPVRVSVDGNALVFLNGRVNVQRSYDPNSGEMHLDFLRVNQGVRGQKIGTQVQAATEAFARALGADTLAMEAVSEGGRDFVGAYVWAKQGWAWATPSAGVSHIRALNRLLPEGAPKLPEDASAKTLVEYTHKETPFGKWYALGFEPGDETERRTGTAWSYPASRTFALRKSLLKEFLKQSSERAARLAASADEDYLQTREMARELGLDVSPPASPETRALTAARIAAAATRTVCVDFDGTLTESVPYRAGPASAPPTQGMRSALTSLRAMGLRIVVHTARPPSECYGWLAQHDVLGLVDTVTNIKVPAFAYIDDRGVHFDGSWAKALAAVRAQMRRGHPPGASNDIAAFDESSVERDAQGQFAEEGSDSANYHEVPLSDERAGQPRIGETVHVEGMHGVPAKIVNTHSANEGGVASDRYYILDRKVNGSYVWPARKLYRVHAFDESLVERDDQGRFAEQGGAGADAPETPPTTRWINVATNEPIELPEGEPEALRRALWNDQKLVGRVTPCGAGECLEVFHGTTTERLSSIVQLGILPGDALEGFTKMYPQLSKAGKSYATTMEQDAKRWADRAAVMEPTRNSTPQRYPQPVVLRLRIPMDELPKITPDRNLPLGEQAIEYRGALRPEWIDAIATGTVNTSAPPVAPSVGARPARRRVEWAEFTPPSRLAAADTPMLTLYIATTLDADDVDDLDAFDESQVVRDDHGRFAESEGQAGALAHLAHVVDRVGDDADLTKAFPHLARGHIGLTREAMPQLKPHRVDALLADLRWRGVTVTERDQRVDALQPTQKELHASKVLGVARRIVAGKMDPNDRPIVVSRDGHILDGHHRWAAWRLLNPAQRVPTITVDLPIEALVRRAQLHSGPRKTLHAEVEAWRAEHESAPLRVLESHERLYSAAAPPVVARMPLTKAETGRLGERLVLGWLKFHGATDARRLNVDLPNFPADLIAGGELLEVKAGLISNHPRARQWRLTLGEPSAGETDRLRSMSSTQKARYNSGKQDAIHTRKDAVLAQLSADLGRPLTTATITLIVDPDRRCADLFKFAGFHDRIGWHQPDVDAAYVTTLHW